MLKGTAQRSEKGVNPSLMDLQEKAVAFHRVLEGPVVAGGARRVIFWTSKVEPFYAEINGGWNGFMM